MMSGIKLFVSKKYDYHGTGFERNGVPFFNPNNNDNEVPITRRLLHTFIVIEK